MTFALCNKWCVDFSRCSGTIIFEDAFRSFYQLNTFRVNHGIKPKVKPTTNIGNTEKHNDLRSRQDLMPSWKFAITGNFSTSDLSSFKFVFFFFRKHKCCPLRLLNSLKNKLSLNESVKDQTRSPAIQGLIRKCRLTGRLYLQA